MNGKAYDLMLQGVSFFSSNKCFQAEGLAQSTLGLSFCLRQKRQVMYLWALANIATPQSWGMSPTAYLWYLYLQWAGRYLEHWWFLLCLLSFVSVVLRTQTRAVSMLGMSPTTEPHLQTWFPNVHILLRALLNETKLASIEPGMQNPLLCRLLRKHLPQYTVSRHVPVSLFVKLCYLMWKESKRSMTNENFPLHKYFSGCFGPHSYIKSLESIWSSEIPQASVWRRVGMFDKNRWSSLLVSGRREHAQ